MRGHAGLRLTEGHRPRRIPGAGPRWAGGLTVTLRPDRHNERDEDSLSGLTATAVVPVRVRNSD